MIKNGIDLNLQNKDGLTAIHVSAAHGNIQIADLLVKAKANLNKVDRYNLTPYLRARSFEDEKEFKEMLRSNGKKVILGRYIGNDIGKLIDAVIDGTWF